MWAIVPLKSPERAKTRLADVLNPTQRRQLLFTLGERMINALHATPEIEAVIVVTTSADVAAFAGALGALPILQADETGTTSAFVAALRELRGCEIASVLMIAGDLPLVTSIALQRLVAARHSANAIVVPDRHRIGTNALLCSPPHALAPSFGGESFDRHLAIADETGVRTRVLEIDELALDLDCAADLNELRLLDHSIATALFATLQVIDAKWDAPTRRIVELVR